MAPTASAEPKRRWYQFRLRTLVIFTAFLAIVAWFGLRSYVVMFDPKLNDVKDNPHAHEDYMRDMMGLPPLPEDRP